MSQSISAIEKRVLPSSLHQSLIKEALIHKTPDIMRIVEEFCAACEFIFDRQVVNDTIIHTHRLQAPNAERWTGYVRPLSQELGVEAYSLNTSAPILDAGMRFYLRTFTNGAVGSAIQPFKEWWAGWYSAQDRVL